MKPFGGIPPDVPLVDRVGKAVREWWRWMNNIQEVTDGGNSGTMADLLTLEFMQPPRDDTSSEIQQLQAIVQVLGRPGLDVSGALDEIRTIAFSPSRGSDVDAALSEIRNIVLSIPKAPVPDAVIDYDGPRGRDYDRTIADMQTWFASLPQVKIEELWQAGRVYNVGTGMTLTADGTLSAIGRSSSTTWDYQANTSITVGPPPSGDIYWNNATQTSATIVGLSHLTFDNVDVDLFIDRITIHDILFIQDKNDSANFQEWQCSGAITIHANSYVEVPVTLLSSGGTGTTGFANNHLLFLALFQAATGLTPGNGIAISSDTISAVVDSNFAFNSGTIALANVAGSTLFGNTSTGTAEPHGTITLGPGGLVMTGGAIDTSASNPSMGVQAATTGPLANTPTYTNGTAGVGAKLTATVTGTLTVDGHVVALNERVLVKNQASSFQNGVYVCTVAGAVGVNYELTRAPNFNASQNINNTGLILCPNGAVNAVTAWEVASGVVTVGTDPVLFALFTSGITIFGAGISNNAGTVVVDAQGTISATATGTINPAGIASCLVNMGTVNTTLTVSNGSYNGQRIRLEVLQGATAHTVTLDSSVVYGTDIASFTASAVANKRDLLQLIWNGTKWMLAAVNHGF